MLSSLLAPVPCHWGTQPDMVAGVPGKENEVFREGHPLPVYSLPVLCDALECSVSA